LDIRNNEHWMPGIEQRSFEDQVLRKAAVRRDLTDD
jgi:hypothetical protein